MGFPLRRSRSTVPQLNMTLSGVTLPEKKEIAMKKGKFSARVEYDTFQCGYKVESKIEKLRIIPYHIKYAGLYF